MTPVKLIALAACLAAAASGAPTQPSGSGPQDSGLGGVPAPDFPETLWSPPPEFAGPSNAALAYYRIWLSTDADQLRAAREGDQAALEAQQPAIDQLMAAAAIDDCDWGIHYAAGPWAMLPHLGKLRNSAGVLNADADRLRAAGDLSAAAARVEAMFRMAEHTRRDRMIISALVSAAISSTACDAAGALLDTGKLAPADARRVWEAAQLSSDPFGARAAIRAEGIVFVGWTRETLTGPDAGRMMAEIAVMASDAADSPLAKLNGEQLAAALDQLAPFYDQAVALFGDPAATDKIQALEQRVQAGDFGPAAMGLAASITHVHDGVARQIEKRKATIERLRQAANP